MDIRGIDDLHETKAYDEGSKTDRATPEPPSLTETLAQLTALNQAGEEAEKPSEVLPTAPVEQQVTAPEQMPDTLTKADVDEASKLLSTDSPDIWAAFDRANTTPGPNEPEAKE